MDDLVKWLGTQLDADERHPADGHPEQVLRRVTAERERLKLHGESYAALRSRKCTWCQDTWPCADLRLTALPYATRPGYRDEWRP